MRFFVKLIIACALCGVLAGGYETSAQTRRKPRPVAGKPKKKKPKKMTTVTIKQWGGPGVSLNLEAQADQPNTFAIEFDCAHGALTGPVKVDAAGRFNVAGTFTPERGGPVRSDDPDRTQPARYTGQVTGDTMTLRVTLTDGKEALGPFKLKANAWGRIVKCL